jgi:ABC-type amino acid transport substrate-binding protein
MPNLPTAAVALLLAAAPAGAQEPLRVYTKPIEPFAFQKNGQATGFSIELWERVARAAGLEYQLTWVKTVPELIEALKSGQADVAVAAISVTSDREKVIDFSQPYYESGLQIMVGPGGTGSAAALMNTLLTWDFARLLGVLVLALFASSHLLWWFERKRNQESFPQRYAHGVWESLWWTSSVLITGGCENKAPTGVGGRLVAVIWMLTGILLVSYLTASVTSAMTVRSLTAGINGPNDLPGQVVATIAGSTAEKYLADHHVEVRPFSSMDEAYAALAGNQVKAVVYDAPVLLYHAAKGGGGQAHVVGRLFEKQNYGIGLQQGSRHRKRINQILLKLGEEGYIAELRRKYFGDSD